MSTTKLTPFFTVEREPLYRNDGTDTGFDAVYRKKDSENLSVVSRQYRLVTHRKTMDFVGSMLDEVGIDNRNVNYELDRGGAKMFANIQFPDYKFTPDGKSQSLDSRATGKSDAFIPRVTIMNSYDKSSSLKFQYGAFQVVCKNGLYIGHKAHEIKMIHYGKEIEWDRLREPFLDRITATIDGIKRVYEKLHEADVENVLYNVLMTDTIISLRYKKMLEEELAGYLDVSYEKDKENQTYVSNFSLRKEIAAYTVWSTLTKIATHRTKSAMTRHNMDRRIAKFFTE